MKKFKGNIMFVNTGKFYRLTTFTAEIIADRLLEFLQFAICLACMIFLHNGC